MRYIKEAPDFYDADGKSPSIHKAKNPFEPVRSYLFSTTI